MPIKRETIQKTDLVSKRSRKRLGQLFLLFGLFFLITPLAGLAQEPTSSPLESTSSQIKIIQIADVNIYNGRIEKQENHQLTISFQLSNGSKVQPDVRYAIYLMQKNEKGYQIIADKKIFLESINMGKRSEEHTSELQSH